MEPQTQTSFMGRETSAAMLWSFTVAMDAAEKPLRAREGGEARENRHRAGFGQQPVRNFRRTLATARPSTGGRNSDPAVAKRMAEEWKAGQHQLGIVDGQSYGHWKDGRIGGTWVAVDPSNCAPPPILDPAQSLGQHNQSNARSSPDVQYQHRAVYSVDTNPFSV